MYEELIAPCGIDCSICSRYLASKYTIRSKGINMSYCTGCRPRNKQCAHLKKKCSKLSGGQVYFCYECNSFPCENLLKFDKKHRTYSRMSVIENLEYIRDNGIRRFIERQQERWKCPECDELLCCHNGICFHCGIDELKNRRKLYSW